MQILKVIELKENEYYQILIFIQGVFSKLNIISMAIIKKLLWLLDIILEDYNEEYFNIIQVI